jgi:hypothetical protein
MRMRTPMRTMPTYRQGRSYRHSSGEAGTCGSFCLLLLIVFPFMIGAPLWTFISEMHHKIKMSSLDEIKTQGVSRLSDRSLPGSVVSLQSNGPIGADVEDAAFGVSINNALSLQRQTEFCQWEEFSTRACQQCERTVRAKGKFHIVTPRVK